MISVADLEAELEGACMDALDGSPAGPRLYARVRRVVGARLRRAGVVADVSVGPGAAADTVQIEIAVRGHPTVERVRVSVEAR